MKRAPNILWIQTDEHRCDSLACYGAKWSKTPALDALAARGVTMRQAFCQSPICSPSRSSQLTARYPQEVCALSNLGAGMPGIFPAGTLTFPEVFAAHGYRTVSLGKTHTPAHPTWEEEERTVLFPRYAGYCRLGDEWSEQDLHVIRRPGQPQLIIGGTYPVAAPTPSKAITDRAIHILRSQPTDEPLLLRVSHNWPHTPVLPPPPFDRLYTADDIPIVPYSEDAKLMRSRRDRWVADRDRMFELDDEQYRRNWCDYMGLVAYVDQQVGRLLEVLNESDRADNTVVLFSADHGRLLGEYGAGEKCTFDDAAWRVPMIWSFPGRLAEGECRDDLCALMDTARTLMGLCGLAESVPATFRGRDLFRDSPPNEVFGQIGWPRMPNGLIGQELLEPYRKQQNGVPVWNHPMRMAVHDARYRMDMDWMRDGERVPVDQLDGNLFDVAKDPYERRNLFSDPAYAATADRLRDSVERAWASWDLPPTLLGR